MFEPEPPPKDLRLWARPAVYVSPHNAAVSSPNVIAALLARQIEARERGEPLAHVVDRPPRLLRRYCFLQVSIVSGVQTSRPIVTGSGTDLPWVRSFRR